MTKILAKDIDQLDTLGEVLHRAISINLDEECRDEVVSRVQAIVSNIACHADQIIDYSADNASMAMITAKRILDRAVGFLEQPDLGVDHAYLSEVHEVAAFYDHTL